MKKSSRNLIIGAAALGAVSYIAGILTAHALIIYKTILSEDDFDSMVDSISDTRHKVKKLAPGETLQ
jgi:hypothetical protein